MMAVNVKLAVNEMYQNIFKIPEGDGDFDRAHIIEMADKIRREEIIGEKAHRWLGWIQAALVIAEIHTLQGMKEVNERASTN